MNINLLEMKIDLFLETNIHMFETNTNLCVETNIHLLETNTDMCVEPNGLHFSAAYIHFMISIVHLLPPESQ